MADPNVQWTIPAPLWPDTARLLPDPSGQTRFRPFNRPAILRFASDTFMQDFLAVVQNNPVQLAEYNARPETWRSPLPAPTPVTPVPSYARTLNRARLARLSAANGAGAATSPSAPAAATGPLKLYQPAHQRFYLVAGCLVCQVAGLPDRTLDTSNEEKVTFVVRRLLPPGAIDNTQPLPALTPESGEEYALVTTAQGTGWQRISGSPASLIAGEEQLPLFAVHYEEGDGRRRRLFAGLVPVGKRESYISAAQLSAAGEAVSGGSAQAAPVDPRIVLFWSEVSEPWKRLVEQAEAAKKILNSNTPNSNPPQPTPGQKKNVTTATREQIQTISWYVLLDFASFLKQYLPNVWLILTGQLSSSALSINENALVEDLKNTTISTDLSNNLASNNPKVTIKSSLFDALVAISVQKIEVGLETVTVPYDMSSPNEEWPNFLFPLADPAFIGPLPPAGVGVILDPLTIQDPNPLRIALGRIDNLANVVEKALPQNSTAAAPALPLAAQPLLDTREGWFVIRCIFERPRCGPLQPPVVSDPTPPFQFAGFFDPDAPARPIRIPLPLDTSPAGLRKFDKNTAFMISDMLCGQIDRVKSLSLGDLVLSVLPWPFHQDLAVPGNPGPCKTDQGLSLGMICSLSIPIITLCALLLLMIIVNLLDIIFHWVPYFLICFPIPGLKSKKPGS